MHAIDNENKLMKINCVVYLVTNLINGKKYVGQTQTTFYKRYNSHGKGAERIKNSYECNGGKGNSHLYNSICKYGSHNFTVEIIHIAQSKEELNYFESFYERYYCTRNPMKGYNKKPCGDSCSGYHRDDEYWLCRIQFDHGIKIKQQVDKFIKKRQKQNTYDGNECYLFAKQKIEYLGVRYDGLLNIPKKIVKTTSIKKLYELDYVVIDTQKNKNTVTPRKIVNEQKRQARIALDALYEPYYDEHGFISDEDWVKIRIEAINIIKNNYVELYENLIDVWGDDINFILRGVYW